MGRFGMHGKLTARQGHREQLILLLMQVADLLREAEGCELYVVHRDPVDEQVVWVTEVWSDQDVHARSLGMPGIRPIVDQAMPVIEAGEATRLDTVGGAGLR